MDDWFDSWLQYHLHVNRHQSFPNPRTDPVESKRFFGLWKRTFEKMNVTRHEAWDASDHLARVGDTWPGEHLSALCERIQIRRREALNLARSARRKKRAEIHQRNVDRLCRLGVDWEALPETEREAIRKHVRAEHPSLATIDHCFRLLCHDRLGVLRGDLALTLGEDDETD
jgi:hypothetical protein